MRGDRERTQQCTDGLSGNTLARIQPVRHGQWTIVSVQHEQEGVVPAFAATAARALPMGAPVAFSTPCAQQHVGHAFARVVGMVGKKRVSPNASTPRTTRADKHTLEPCVSVSLKFSDRASHHGSVAKRNSSRTLAVCTARTVSVVAEAAGVCESASECHYYGD